jgi:hypothetical protein
MERMIVSTCRPVESQVDYGDEEFVYFDEKNHIAYDANGKQLLLARNLRKSIIQNLTLIIRQGSSEEDWRA